MSDDPATETGCAALIEENLPALRELCRRFGVRRLDLFGSAATGRFDLAHSDLDFLVEFEEMLPSAYAKAYWGLRESLEALFNKPVDMLTQSCLKNPYLRRQIEFEKQVLYSSS